MTPTQVMELLRPAVQNALENGTILELITTIVLDLAPLVEEEELCDTISFAESV